MKTSSQSANCVRYKHLRRIHKLSVPEFRRRYQSWKLAILRGHEVPLEEYLTSDKYIRRKNKGRPRKYYYARQRLFYALAVPKWVDQEKLCQIYADCPDGYHVDHIIPLRGENFCGLHVPWNLQYLPAKENMKKGNKLIP